MGKLDIFNPVWLEVVFTGRNQSYGAYQLRKANSSTTNKALLIGCVVFVLAVSMPLIARYIKGILPTPDKEKITEVTLTPPPPVDASKPPPPPIVEPPKPKVDQIKFPPPVVVPRDQVKDEEPPTVEELKVADPGQKTIEGDPTQEVRIDEPVGEAPVGSAVTEDTGIYDIASIEVQPEYPGGISKFLEWVGNNYKYTAAAQEAGVSGKVIMSFVVEKDGTLTDIKVLRDLGYGTGAAAISTLKKSKAWKPGVQNGRAVRVQYTLPLALQIEGQ